MALIAAATVRFLVSTTENRTFAFRHAPTTALLPYAESPRTRISPVAPAARAVLIASRTIDAAPLPEPALPARSRIPAITGAACRVLIVVANGDRPLRRTCLPA